jgi:hypothetical protein
MGPVLHFRTIRLRSRGFAEGLLGLIKPVSNFASNFNP